MMLCCLHDGFDGTVGLSLSQVFLESISEDGQLAIGLEASEGFLGLQQWRLGLLTRRRSPVTRHCSNRPRPSAPGRTTSRQTSSARALSAAAISVAFMGALCL